MSQLAKVTELKKGSVVMNRRRGLFRYYLVLKSPISTSDLHNNWEVCFFKPIYGSVVKEIHSLESKFTLINGNESL